MELEPILHRLPDAELDQDAAFAFSVHKCGSTMMHAMIFGVCKRARIPSISIPDTLFNMGILEKDWQIDPSLIPLFERKLLYYGFRNLPQILTQDSFNLKGRRFVLLVRDPRDALVSQYFSFGRKQASHRLPKENPDAYRKIVEAQPERTIDEYVLAVSRNLRNKLEAYRDNLDFDQGMVRRYEDVFFDKQVFLREIFEHFTIEVPEKIIEDVARAHDIRPEQEDDSKHIRKGTPGDHAEKLQPETIAKLNDVFRDVGAFYGYKL